MNLHRHTLVLAAILATGLGVSACATPEPRPFDAESALADVEKQLGFGPRVPGTEAHRRCAQWLARELRATTQHVVAQEFRLVPPGDSVSPAPTDTLTHWNIIAAFNRESTDRIMICAHWDSRRWADQDPDSARHRDPVPGANDGGSGVAVCLELARIMGESPPPFGVDLVLFDGEDQGRPSHPEEFLMGSKWYVRQAPGYRPLAVILLDMIGDRDLGLPREAYSDTLAPALTDLVWQSAARLALPAFTDSIGGAVVDDHLPFLFSGIAAVDIIDFSYPHWHTIEDTTDKVSAESLDQIGRLIRELIYYTPVEDFRAASRVVPPQG